MANTQDHTNVFTGTAQQERLLRALLPSYIKIDERTVGDHLAFASQYAAFLQYFNESDQPIGNWQSFINKDEVVFLANLMTTPTAEIEKKIKSLIHQIINAREGDPEEESVPEFSWEESDRRDLLVELFSTVVRKASTIDGWFKKVSQLRQGGQRTLTYPILETAIKGELAEGLQLLHYWTTQLAERELDFPVDVEVFRSFSPDWGLSLDQKEGETDHVRYIPSEASPNDLFLLLLEDVRKFSQRLSLTSTYLTERAPHLLEQSLNEYDDHPPDIGLLLTFLKLLGFAQDHLNTLTRRHLDYYFLSTLQQKLKKPKPDWTIIQFTLAENIFQHILPQGTRLLADINSEGVASHYQTTSDIVLTPVQVAELKTVHVSKNPLVGIGSSYRLISDIFAAPIANSRDGFGEPFTVEDGSWPIFGEDQLLKAARERQMGAARLGFAIASPVLVLEQAQRLINIHLQVSDDSRLVLRELILDIDENYELVFGRLFGESLLIYGSGPEGWFPIEEYVIQPDESEKGDIVIRLPLTIEMPSLVGMSPVVLEEGLDTHLPVIKVILDPTAPVFPYSFLNELELEAMIVEAQVFEVRNLGLYNDLGQLDPSAPFYPFGSLPQVGSYLLVGNAEIFSKPLKELSLAVTWGTPPFYEKGWKTYFDGYPGELDNNSFELKLTALSNYRFHPHSEDEKQVFKLFGESEPDAAPEETTRYEDIDLSKLRIKPDYKMSVLPEFQNDIRAGYLKIELCAPNEMFGHKIFPRILSEALVHNSNPKNKEQRALPNEPYTPLMTDVYIDYRAESKINLDETKFRENDPTTGEKVFHIHPFGKEIIYQEGKASKNYLFPHFEYEGYLYIGLTGLQPPQLLYLFFNLEESTNKSSKAPLEVQWSYLRSNSWQPMGQEELISDGTEGFTTAGIVTIALPEFMTKDNSILSGDKYWLRVAARGDLQIIGRAFEVVPNAVMVDWMDNGDAKHYEPETKLPPLEQLLEPQPEIAEVKQLIPFQGRYPLESQVAFYVRTSERLRHKNRGIDRWDLEHLILEHFPNVQQAKCIGPTEEYTSNGQVPAGSVYLAVVPRIDGVNIAPKLGYNFLIDIQDYLAKLVSPFVQVKVMNPNYETLKIACSILLKKGLYSLRGQYLRQLHLDIKEYLCPWLDGDSVMQMGGSIRKTDLLNFIKALPYVEFVTRFSIAQIYEDETGNYEILDTARPEHDRDLIETTTPWSVLIPVDQHQITFLEQAAYEEPEVTAIERMRVQTDFVVLMEDEDWKEVDPGLAEVPEEEFVPPDEEEDTDWFLILGGSTTD